MEIKPEDLSINTWSSKPKSGFSLSVGRGIQILHIPSGIVVQCESERSQHQNKAIAISQLQEKLKEWDGVVVKSKNQQIAELQAYVEELHNVLTSIYVIAQRENGWIDLKEVSGVVTEVLDKNPSQSLEERDKRIADWMLERCCVFLKQNGHVTLSDKMRKELKK